MTLIDVVALVKRRFWTIFFSFIAGVICAGTLLTLQPVRYTASSSGYVRVELPSDLIGGGSTGSFFQAAQLASEKAQVYVPVFQSTIVSQGVIDRLNLDTSPGELARGITASHEAGSLIINVNATASTPEDAQKIADAVVLEANEQVRQLEGSRSPVEIVLMASSVFGTPEKSPSTSRYLFIGAVLGVLLGVILALIRDATDKKIRDSGEAAHALGAPSMGEVPLLVTGDSHSGKNLNNQQLFEESLRKIRTNLRYARLDSELRCILVTSALSGEGKSTISTRLARVMALAGSEVLLIEADLRRPVLRQRFNIPSNRPGLTHLLLGAVSLEETICKTETPGLNVMVAGDIPPNPSELLGSQRMSELIAFLSKKYIVIIDTAPVLPVSDAAALSHATDGVLVVSKYKSTTSVDLNAVGEALRAVDAPILGIVLNKVVNTRATTYTYSSHKQGHLSTLHRATRSLHLKGNSVALGRHSAGGD